MVPCILPQYNHLLLYSGRIPKLLAVFSIGHKFHAEESCVCAETDDSQDSRKKEGAIFIPLYHFQPLKNMQILIFDFASEMNTRILNRIVCNYHTATQ